MKSNRIPNLAAAALRSVLQTAYRTALLLTNVAILLGLLALPFLPLNGAVPAFQTPHPAILVALKVWLGTAWVWALLKEALACLSANPAEAGPAPFPFARRAAELLRGLTCGTLLSAAGVLFVWLALPGVFHTILTNLDGVNPTLLACGRLGLLVGVANYCFGSFLLENGRSAAALFAGRRICR